jgi:hypothetical protein
MATTRLEKTFTASNRKTFTISTWIKRSALTVNNCIYSAGTNDSTDRELLVFLADAGEEDKLYFNAKVSNSTVAQFYTNRRFRDVGAFYHIVLAFDTTQATDTNRMKLYVNGELETFSSVTYPNQNRDMNTNNTVHKIGSTVGNGQYFNGLMSYFAFTDGTAYTPTSFGETDSSSGIWKWKSPSVTYGTNGFFLKMDTSSPGTDTSGNSNTFTASGTPTLTQDNASNNFCTLTPLIRMAITLNNGNTQVTDTDSSWYGVGSTMGVSSGKWYWEYKLTRIGNYAQDGVMGGLPGNGYNDIYNTYVGSKTAGVALNTGEGKIYSADSSTTWFGSANSQGQIIGVALDLDNNKIYYSQNGVFGNSSNPATNTNGYALSATIIANKPLLPCSSINNCTIDYNFGNGFFGTTAVASSNADAEGHGLMEYAVPTGFYTLNTKNLNTYG